MKIIHVKCGGIIVEIHEPPYPNATFTIDKGFRCLKCNWISGSEFIYHYEMNNDFELLAETPEDENLKKFREECRENYRKQIEQEREFTNKALQSETASNPRFNEGRIPKKYSKNPEDFEARLDMDGKIYNAKGRNRLSYRWKNHRN